MDRNRSHSSPMSHHKEEARKDVEVEVEVAREEDNRRATIRGRIISTEDNQAEVVGNPEAEVGEVVMIEVLIKGNPEWPVKLQIKTDVITAMSLDISQENAPKGIMAMQTLDPNNRKLFLDSMWFNHKCMLKCQFLKWLRFQYR